MAVHSSSGNDDASAGLGSVDGSGVSLALEARFGGMFAHCRDSLTITSKIASETDAYGKFQCRLLIASACLGKEDVKCWLFRVQLLHDSCGCCCLAS